MARNPLSAILESNKLDGKNYTDWLRNLKIVLDSEKRTYVLTESPPKVVPQGSSQQEIDTIEKWKNDDLQTRCLMLASMTAELQKQHEHMRYAADIHLHLKELFAVQDRMERYAATRELFGMKMSEGTDVRDHGLKMVGLIEKLEKLDFTMDNELYIDLILQTLPRSFEQFIINFNMNKIEVSISELINMLKTAQSTMVKEKPVLVAVPSGPTKPKTAKKGKKGKGKVNKAKGGVAKKSKAERKKDKCFHCGETGHWKRNCKNYIDTLAKDGMFFLEIDNLSIDITSWVFDTGCGAHLCNNLQVLQRSRKLSKRELVLRLGDGSTVEAKAVGEISLEVNNFSLFLKDVYYVPNLIKNIISISVLDKEGFSFNISDGTLHVMHDNVKIEIGTLINGLYVLKEPKLIFQLQAKKRKINQDDAYLWHARLGHISKNRIHKMVTSGALDLKNLEEMQTCESCLKGKMTKSPFVGQVERTTNLLELVHTDVCGPLSVSARGNYSYFITFTDDFSRYGYVYLMRNKSEAFEKFKEFKNEVENQLDRQIKTLRSDRGGEYLSDEFLGYLRQNGILSQWTPPGTPQLNGVSERRNRTLMDMVRSMMSSSDLPLSFWGYALETATKLLNIVPSKSVPKTPYEMWRGKAPSYSYLRIWGSPAYVKKLVGDKLDSRSILCKFVGYPKESVGYYFYDPKDQKVFVSRNAVFLENELSCDEVHDKERIEEVRDLAQNPQTLEAVQSVLPEVQPLRRTERISRAPERYGFMTELEQLDKDPTTYEEALCDKDSGKWHEAMKSEMDSMYSNKVWTLVDPPEGVRPVGCKWIYKRKLGADGEVATFKARLVAKGYTQRPGVDFEETYSPVAMPKSIRILFAIAAYYDYEIWQMDVKTAFLNGNIEEDIYMDQPPGFTSNKSEQKVCKLNRSIYGLKQASRSWNLRFDEVIKSYGFIFLKVRLEILGIVPNS